jgi:glycosyltransferase 2 family protein
LTLAGLRTKFLLSVLFGIAVIAALAFYADAGKLAAALAAFPYVLVLPILALTLLNYGIRFVKWHYYLGQVGVRGLSLRDSAAVFFAGLTMTLTPGKVGEWLKSYLLREIVGVPFFQTAPVVLVERATDGLAMILLATGGLILFQVGWQIIAIVLFIALAVLVVCWSPPLAEVGFRLAERLPVVSGLAGHLRVSYASAQVLVQPKNLLIGIGLGFISWSGECVAYYLVLTGLGQSESFELMVQAAFILAVASLGGSLLLVPGGLGVAEGGITGFAQLLLGMPRELAVTSALLIRLSTLWFGVTIGLVTLTLLTRRLGKLRPVILSEAKDLEGGRGEREMAR